ncbi:UNVERIFIED_CONTAM: hypothetical protein NCL1_52077 [Trichonephila clavipes]
MYSLMLRRPMECHHEVGEEQLSSLSGKGCPRQMPLPTYARFFLMRWLYAYGLEPTSARNADLVERLGVSDKTVSKALQALVSGGYLLEESIFTGKRGRPRRQYRISQKSVMLLRLDGHEEPIHWDGLIEKASQFKWYENSYGRQLVLMVLLAHADSTGVVRGLSMRTLCKLVGERSRTVRSHISGMMVSGFIRRFYQGMPAIGFLRKADGCFIMNTSHVSYEGLANGCMTLVFKAERLQFDQGFQLLDAFMGRGRREVHIPVIGGVALDLSELDKIESERLFGNAKEDIVSAYLQCKIEEYAAWLLVSWPKILKKHDQGLVNLPELDEMIARDVLADWVHEMPSCRECLSRAISAVSILLAMYIKSRLLCIYCQRHDKKKESLADRIGFGRKMRISIFSSMPDDGCEYYTLQLFGDGFDSESRSIYIFDEIFSDSLVMETDARLEDERALSLSELMAYGEVLMRIMRLTEVIHFTGLCRTNIYQLMSEDKFPRSVSLGGRSVGWVSTEIEDWIAAKVEERDKGVA